MNGSVKAEEYLMEAVWLVCLLKALAVVSR
jgi:hypothetical protein